MHALTLASYQVDFDIEFMHSIMANSLHDIRKFKPNVEIELCSSSVLATFIAWKNMNIPLGIQVLA